MAGSKAMTIFLWALYGTVAVASFSSSLDAFHAPDATHSLVRRGSPEPHDDDTHSEHGSLASAPSTQAGSHHGSMHDSVVSYPSGDTRRRIDSAADLGTVHEPKSPNADKSITETLAPASVKRPSGGLHDEVADLALTRKGSDQLRHKQQAVFNDVFPHLGPPRRDVPHADDVAAYRKRHQQLQAHRPQVQFYNKLWADMMVQGRKHPGTVDGHVVDAVRSGVQDRWRTRNEHLKALDTLKAEYTPEAFGKLRGQAAAHEMRQAGSDLDLVHRMRFNRPL